MRSSQGHIVSKDGIETEKKKITTIQEWPVPKTVTKVCSFWGFYKLLLQIHTQICPDCTTFQSISVWREC